ncbi:MAG TPA: Tn3 family transposase [Ktedonobacterales bacterium]|nr:Tn3 family transposase [Ktedonobacterales bacterium]
MSTQPGIIQELSATPSGGASACLADCALSACDLALINAAHDDHHRLARALLLIWARADPMMAAHPALLSEAIITGVSAQLGIRPEMCPCEEELAFPNADVKAVQGYLRLRSMNAEDAAHLRGEIAAQVPQKATTAELIEAAYAWLAEQGILRPLAKTVIQRLVYQVRHETEEQLFERLTQQLGQEQRAQLDELCEAKQGRSALATLVTPPRAASIDAIRDEAQRLQRIRAALPDTIDWLGIQPPRLWQWAAIVKRLSAQALRRYPPAKRYALLLAFLTVRGPEVTDAIVEMFDTLVGRLFARSSAELREVQMEQAQTHLSSARLFRRITQVLLDAKVPPHLVRDHIFQQVSREQVSALVKRSQSLEESEAELLFALLKARFTQAREVARVVLQALHFSAPDEQNPVLAGLETLRGMDRERRKKTPRDAPLDFVPQRWLKVVSGPDGIDRRAWELCLLHQARQALRGGDLTVEGSQNYTPWTTHLYTSDEWRQRRADWFSGGGPPEQATDYIVQARAELDALAIRAAAQMPNHPYLQIQAGRLILTAQERLQTPPASAATRRSLTALLPRVGLPQLLQEVDSWTGFTSAFDHLTTRREPTASHQQAIRPALLAVLVAEATNIGLTAMSAASGIPHGQLVRVADWYLREETLQQAIRILIAFHQSLPLTREFGSGHLSASSESEFARLISGPLASQQAARGGASRKVSMYSHVSDQAMQFWVGLVNPLAQEAAYALDGLIAQQLPPNHEHIANIAGGNDLLFGLAELLGYRLALPLPDLADHLMTRPQESQAYGALDALLKYPLRESLISEQWETLNRLAASLRDQLARPSALLPKLHNMHEETTLRLALQEMGRIARTRYLLHFIADPEVRQRVLAGQLRCASLDAMARAIFFGQQGRLSDRDAAAYLRRALALSLVLNAIIVWNTRHLEAAAQESAQRGQPIADEMWHTLHPIMWEHIHLVGAYCFAEGHGSPEQKEMSHSACSNSEHAE